MQQVSDTEKDKISLSIFRYDPSVDSLPRYERFEVEYGPKMRVLDALEAVRNDLQITDLAFRWFCGIKKCGTCGLMVSGFPMLSCWEPASDGMVLDPLVNFPIIRDLVVDTGDYERLVLKVDPILRRSSPLNKWPEKISHDRMIDMDKLQACFECYLCTSGIPASGISHDGIEPHGLGPAAIVKLAKVALDPRDASDRGETVIKAGVSEMPLFDILSRVCPQNIDIIEDALLPLKKKYSVMTSVEEPTESIIVFIMAQKWSAFVRLSRHEVDSLSSVGVLVPVKIDGINESFRLSTGMS